MGNALIWPEASYDQQEGLAFAPKVTSALSIMGSCYILVDIYRLKRRNAYHRILLGMNLMDLVSQSAWFFTTWPIPVGTYGVVNAKGNQRTCDAQGFFSQLSISTVLYNVCLAVYFLLVIRHGWTEKKIAETRLELYFHSICIGVGIGTALIAQFLHLYNPAGWQCWIAVAPAGCAESWQFSRPTQEEADILAFEQLFVTHAPSYDMTTPPPCTRGNNANLYVWFLFYCPLWVSTIIATACHYRVVTAYRAQDQIVEKWRQKLLMASEELTQKQKRISSTATPKPTTKNFVEAALRPFTRRNQKRRRTPSTTPTFTPAQRKKLNTKQQHELEDPLDHQRRQPMTDDSQTSQFQASLRVFNIFSSSPPSQPGTGVTTMGDGSRSSVNSLNSPNTTNTSHRKSLPPVLGSQTYHGRTHPNIDQLNNSSKTNNSSQRTISSRILNYKPPKLSLRKNTKRQQQKNAKSKLVASQAMLYLCSFYVAWLFPSIARIQESTSSAGIAYYHWMLLSAIFCPLQGLMNFIVYIRPKYLAIRRERRRMEAIQKQHKQLQLLKQQQQQQAAEDPNNDHSFYRNFRNTTTATTTILEEGERSTIATLAAGSSSALYTIQSDEAVADSQQLVLSSPRLSLEQDENNNTGEQQLQQQQNSSLDRNHPNPQRRQPIRLVDAVPTLMMNPKMNTTSDDEDNEESSKNQEDDDIVAVWREADHLAAVQALEEGETAREVFLMEEPVSELQFGEPSSPQTLPRARASDPDLLVLSTTVDEEELMEQFNNSVNCDSRHVSLRRLRTRPHDHHNDDDDDHRNHNSETSFASVFSNSLRNLMQGTSNHDTSNHTRSSRHDSFNGESSSLSFATAHSSGFVTAYSSGMMSLRSSGVSSASFSIQSAVSVPSPFAGATDNTVGSPSMPQSISTTDPRDATSTTTTRVSTFAADPQITSILEEETSDDEAVSLRTGPHPSHPSRPQHQHHQQQQQQIEDIHPSRSDPHDDYDPLEEDVGGRTSMGMVPLHDEVSRKEPRPMRKAVSATVTKGVLKNPTTRSKSNGRKGVFRSSAGSKSNSSSGKGKKQRKGVTWRRTPADNVMGDSDGEEGSLAGSSSAGLFSTTSLSATGATTSKRKISRREIMKKSKKAIKTSGKVTKKIAKGGVKGGKSGIKSIRTFASTVKDALKADYNDDWATALDEDDILGYGARPADYRSTDAIIEAEEEVWHDSVVFHEDYKEEVDMHDQSQSYHDAFHDPDVDVVFQKQGSNRYIT